MADEIVRYYEWTREDERVSEGYPDTAYYTDLPMSQIGANGKPISNYVLTKASPDYTERWMYHPFIRRPHGDVYYLNEPPEALEQITLQAPTLTSLSELTPEYIVEAGFNWQLPTYEPIREVPSAAPMPGSPAVIEIDYPGLPHRARFWDFYDNRLTRDEASSVQPSPFAGMTAEANVIQDVRTPVSYTNFFKEEDIENIVKMFRIIPSAAFGSWLERVMPTKVVAMTTEAEKKGLDPELIPPLRYALWDFYERFSQVDAAQNKMILRDWDRIKFYKGFIEEHFNSLPLVYFGEYVKKLSLFLFKEPWRAKASYVEEIVGDPTRTDYLRPRPGMIPILVKDFPIIAWLKRRYLEIRSQRLKDSGFSEYWLENQMVDSLIEKVYAYDAAIIDQSMNLQAQSLIRQAIGEQWDSIESEYRNLKPLPNIDLENRRASAVRELMARGDFEQTLQIIRAYKQNEDWIIENLDKYAMFITTDPLAMKS